MKSTFYEGSMLKVPEFVNGNYYTFLKETEQNLLVEHLVKVEEDQRQQRQLQEEAQKQSQAASGSALGKPPGKADAKKDAKAAPAKKGGAPTEDKNAPKAIIIDYPEVPAAPTFTILERSFTQMKGAMIHNLDAQYSSGLPSKKSQPAKEVSHEEKKAQRTKELLKEFQIVRGLPFTLTVKTRFNLPEEVEQVKKEPETVIDPKKKK